MRFSELEPYRGRIIVACSGGADSVCLAHQCMERAREEALETPLLAYVDHGLRAESGDEAQSVQALAERFGGRAAVLDVEVEGGASLEGRAREARYEALDELCRSEKADWVLLAHTSSDQAETVLMRVLRGTGVRGLAGIPARRRPYARPLLGWSRADTEAYCRERELPFVDDPMNRDPRHTRSRIRHHWLPELRAENPRLDQALVRLSEEARDLSQLVDELAEAWIEERSASLDELPVGATWASTPAAVRARLLLRSAERAGVGPLEEVHIRALDELCSAPSEGTRTLDIPGGFARRAYDQLEWVSGAVAKALPASEAVECEPGYVLRPFHPGERMQAARLQGHSKKLSRLYQDLKVPRNERAGLRVLVEASSGRVLWAERIGLAHGVELGERLTARLHELIK